MTTKTTAAVSSEPWASAGEIRIGVSACLLGEKVRFDGGHKHARFLTDHLGELVTFVPVCPEVEVGMGIPRETIRLEVGPDGETRLVAPRSETDHTVAMERYAKRRSRELQALDLSGYVLKKGSPSCGMERVKLYDRNGMPSKGGVGVFARALLERLPLLPVEEEGRLNDPHLRENFIERVFAYRRLRNLFEGRWARGDLVRFHTAEKLLILAHNQAAYRRLGRLVATAKGRPPAEVATEYSAEYMGALARIARRRAHVNVLQHAIGHFRTLLDQEDRDELHAVIDDFGRGLVPLIVPITLIRHHLRRHDVAWLRGQVYFDPHPKELMLRNHS